MNNDTISRQAAIDALDEYFVRIGKLKRRGLNKGEKAISLDTVGVIKTLPSAQPEHPGKCKWCERLKERNLRIEYYWIDQEGCTASFSEPHIVATGIANFCPNCGAKMEGEQDG